MRWKSLAVVIAWVGLQSIVSASEVEVEVVPLVDGVWVHTSWQQTESWGRVQSNGLVVREGKQLVVVDTAWGAEPSRALLAWIDRELKLPVARLIVTHFHDDRLGGWEVFAERGVRVVASPRTLELAGVTPTDAFDLYRLAIGEKQRIGEVEIFYPGRAHAEDNVVVWVPAVKVLAGGCAVRAAESRGLGNVADASVSNWANTIRRVLAAYPDAAQVLPGHGAVGNLGLLHHTIALADAAPK